MHHPAAPAFLPPSLDFDDEVTHVTGAPCPSDELDLPLDTRLGHHQIVRRIAEGGMGVIYEARHVHLGRRAAVKVLRPELTSSEELVERFLGEAIAASSIGHPGVVAVHDYGYAASGAAYLVMEYLEGESLAERLLQRLPLWEVLTIGGELASALAAAHAAGIVHRDLKPDNIFLARDRTSARGERVKLLDFGVAKFLARRDGASYSSHGHVLGTPRYMSPEQALGARDLDQRSDVYALGCLLFHLACGRPPFLGNMADVLTSHQAHAPPAPSSYEPRLPGAFDALLGRMLEKSPDRRPRSMHEVAAELAAIAEKPSPPRAVIPRVDRSGSRGLAPTVLSKRARPASRLRRDRARFLGLALFFGVLAAGLALGLPTLAPHVL